MAWESQGGLGMAQTLTTADRARLLSLLTRSSRESNDDHMAHMIIVDFNRFLVDTGRVYEDTVPRDGLPSSGTDDTVVAIPQ